MRIYCGGPTPGPDWKPCSLEVDNTTGLCSDGHTNLLNTCTTCGDVSGRAQERQYFVCTNGHANNLDLMPPGHCRIYDLVSSLTRSEDPPLEYDIGLAPVHKRVETVWRGDQTLIRYYAEPSYTTPVCQRSFAVSYPDDSPPRVEVVEELAWYCQDGSLHPTTKTLTRVYDGQRWLDWLEGKRKQIIEWLRYNVAAAMLGNLMQVGNIPGSQGDITDLSGVMSEGGRFFATFSASISGYIGGYAQAFPEAVASSQDWPWLDLPWPGEQGQTIRGKFAEQLIYT